MRAFFLRHIALPQEGHEFPLIEIGEYEGRAAAVPIGGFNPGFQIEWHEAPDPCPAIAVYSDMWGVLSRYADLFQSLAALGGSNVTLEDVCMMLVKNGFVDQTDAILAGQGIRRDPGPTNN